MNKREDKKSPPSRRKFLVAGIFATLGVFISGFFGLRNAILFLFPKPQDEKYTKYLVAKVDEIPSGESKEVTIADKPVFIIHLPEGFKIFSGICPHLGCVVKWKEKEKHFYCPCHKAIFDKDGTLLAGPSPRPLDEFRVEVEGSLVFVWIAKGKNGIKS